VKVGNSLRGRLLVAVMAASAVVLLTAGAALYMLVRVSLLKEIDTALIQQAQVMTSMFEWKTGRVDLDLDNLIAQAKVTPGNRQYFEVWQEGAGLLARSPGLESPILAHPEYQLTSPRLDFVRLPQSQLARMLVVTVRPKVEGADDGVATSSVVAAPRVTLLLASDLRKFENSLDRLAYLLVAVGLAAMLASAGGVWWAVGYGLRPMRILAQRISNLDEGNLDQRVELPLAPRELLSVVTRLNQLLERLEAAFGREKALLANLAHELRTPLAGLSVTLEVALSRPRDPEDYVADMRQCLTISRQMQGMVDNLLTMARLDAGQKQSQGICIVNLEEALGQVWASLDDQALQKGLLVDWEPTPGVSALAEPHGLLIILRNLLANAVDYADQGGHLWVSTRQREERVEISIANTASRLSPQDIDRVFERFWRGDQSRSGDQAHAGLGLALSRQLAEAMHGCLEASCDAQGRFLITLSLPGTTAQESRAE